MRKVPPSELRFQLLRGLQQIPQSTLRDLAGAPDKRSAALESAADTLMARMHDKEVFGPDPIPNHG